MMSLMGFEPQTSGVGCNCSTNRAATTARNALFVKLTPKQKKEDERMPFVVLIKLIRKEDLIEKQGFNGQLSKGKSERIDFFSTSLFYPLFLCQTFLAFISAPTGFHNWGLVTGWARLLITLLTATYPAHRKIKVR